MRMIPTLKFKLFTICCAASILGFTFTAKAAEDTFVPASKVTSSKSEDASTAKSTDASTAKASDTAAVKTTNAPVAKLADEPSKKAADAPAKKAEEKSSGWSSKAGAELWAQDCRQCHNVRSPATLSSAEWENAIAHMRFRCNLTAKEYRKIAEFLQAASAH